MSIPKMNLRPFSDLEGQEAFKGDKLDRKAIANDLTALLTQAHPPFVLAVDGQWGSGKSWLFHNWNLSLRDKGFETVCFNAWENDFGKSPLTALICETSNQIQSKRSKRALTKLKKIGAGILKASIPVGIKVMTSGLVDLTPLLNDETEKTAQKAVGDAANSAIENSFKEYENAKMSVDAFKKTLGIIANEAYASKGNIEGDDERPLVFLIDELDRCRPDYAIEFLEVAKHFFDAPRVVFVIAVDYLQLKSSISSSYGRDINKDGYLRKFFDLRYALPKPSIADFLRSEFENVGVGPVPFKTDTLKIFELLFEHLGLDLRSQQRILARFAVGTRMQDFTRHDDMKIIYFQILVILQEWRQPILEKFLSGGIDHNEFFRCVGNKLNGEINVRNTPYSPNTWALIRACLLMMGANQSDSFRQEASLIKEKIENGNATGFEREIDSFINWEFITDPEKFDYMKVAKKTLEFAYHFEAS